MSKYLWNWFPSYLKERLRSVFTDGRGDRFECPRHVMFLFVDHLELAGKSPRLERWLERYPALASRHVDFDGKRPKHTWFYAMDLMREEELVQLKTMVESGLGEIELHWHHGGDTPETFLPKLRDGLRTFQKHGFMRPSDGKKSACFAFIHGNWSLDNSLGPDFCGVDNEIALLRDAGCYADFTFPALFSKAQPATINSIYYVVDDGKPKSYERGRVARVGVGQSDDEFMIFQGPLTVNWRDWRFKWHPGIEDGEINKSNSHDNTRRIDAWIAQGIGVVGRPEWIFVKVFCHGGQDHAAVLGDATDRMFTYLEKRYNDGAKNRLHYVTAREAYNIVKAAEDGRTGDPNEYRDYVLPPPLHR